MHGCQITNIASGQKIDKYVASNKIHQYRATSNIMQESYVRSSEHKIGSKHIWILTHCKHEKTERYVHYQGKVDLSCRVNRGEHKLKYARDFRNLSI